MAGMPGIIVKITSDVKGAVDGINRVSRAMDEPMTRGQKFSGVMDSLGGTLGKLAAGAGAAIALEKVGQFLLDSAKAAMEDEASLTKLKVAMQNLGMAAASTGVENFITQMSLATGVSDDMLRPAMARLLRSTEDVGQSQRALQLAMNVSAATGKDLDTVANALGKAFDGNAASLGRLGLGLDKATLKSGDMDKILGTLETKFAGQAAAAADTYAGKMQRVSVAVNEAQEGIGYRLLDSIDQVSTALGGPNGAIDAITATGVAIEGLITASARIVTPLAQMTTQLSGVNNDAQTASDSVTNILDRLSKITLFTGGVGISLFSGFWSDSIRANDAVDELANTTDLAALRYQAMSDAINGTTEAQDALSAQYDDYASAADDAAAAQQELTDQYKDWKKTIDDSQSMDDFKAAISGLGKDLDKNVRSFSGMSDSAKENRDRLRELFADAAKQAQDWAASNGASAQEAASYYDGLADRIVDGFVKNGFKRKDVKAFLGEEAIYTGPIEDVSVWAKTQAFNDFYDVGRYGIGDGTVKGMEASQMAIRLAAQGIAYGAKAATMAALDMNSPSKVFIEIGSDVVAGFVEGMDSKEADARAAARRSMVDSVLSAIKEGRAELESALKDARDAVAQSQSDFASSIGSGLNLGDAYEAQFDSEGKATGVTFLQGFQSQIDQADWFANVLEAVKAQAGPNSPLVAEIAAQGPGIGGALGQQMLDEGLVPTIDEKWTAVQARIDAAAGRLVPPFLQAGVDSAQALLDKFREQYGPDGEGRKRLMGLMDRLAEKLDRTAKITVVLDDQTGGFNVNVGKRAAGGPVSAGSPYIVGERGPELFLPSVSGSIVPNHALGGGNNYSITVQAGVGDPAAIGRTVVESIRAYERRNGQVFVSA